MASNMAAVPASAYIPPHLRKASIANGKKRDSGVELQPVDASPVASVKSKTDAVQVGSSL